MKRMFALMMILSVVLLTSCSSGKQLRYDASDKRTWWCEEYVRE